MLNTEQKRRRVIELYKKGYTWDQICADTRMSKRNISEIIREIDPRTRRLSPRTKALSLFANGKSILEVIMALDMPYEEARIVEEQHLAIQNRGKLAELYDKYENKDCVDSIMILSSLLNENNVSMKELEDVIFYSRRVSELEKQVNLLNIEVSRREEKKRQLDSQNFRTLRTINREAMILFQNRSQNSFLMRQNDQLTTQELQLKAKIATQMNLVLKGEPRIKQIIQNQLEKNFYQYESIFGIVFYCFIEYIRNSQDRELFKYLFESDHANSQNIEWLQSYEKLVKKVNEISIPFRNLLLIIVEKYVTNYQPEQLTTDKKRVQDSL